jgi:hypothetical protein
MKRTIYIINGATLEHVGTIDTEDSHDNAGDSIVTLMQSYIPARGELIEQDWSSDSIAIAKYADGTTLGFSI